jgi:hypothetical protein
MNIAEILIWESTNALLLIPVVIGLLMLVRWIRGRLVFTESDWLFLFGHPRGGVLRLPCQHNHLIPEWFPAMHRSLDPGSR